MAEEVVTVVVAWVVVAVLVRRVVLVIPFRFGDMLSFDF